MSGDMMFDTATGVYHLFKGKVYLKYLQLKADIFAGDALVLPSTPPTIQVKQLVPFEYDYMYFIGRDKLFGTHVETGAKVTKAFGYSKRRKHWLFGTHWYKRRYFLQKVDSE